jgi:membrane fusion protein (multidrug efflux system)
VYEIATSARLEIEQASHPVQSVVAGRVVRTALELGHRVCPDDVLLELDSRTQVLSRQESQARRDALDILQAAINRQITSLRRELAQAIVAGRREISEARARASQSRVASEIAARRAQRARVLADAHLIAPAELESGVADESEAVYATQAANTEVARLEAELRRQQSARDAELDSLNRQVSDLDAERLTIDATIARLDYEISLRTLRAPVCGRLADVVILRPGSYLAEGQRVATIVPDGRMRIVAQYPASAFGRLAEGQRGQMRLQGFPWTEYGSLPVTVTTVGREASDGLVRVELDVHPRQGSAIPLQHGMPGTLEIEIERVSPATLLLRAVGRGAF